MHAAEPAVASGAPAAPQDVFIAAALRELRGPLTPIGLDVDGLESDLGRPSRGAERAQVRLQRLQRHIKTLLSRTELLLTAARVRNNDFEPCISPTALLSRLEPVCATLDAVAQQAGSQIQIRGADLTANCDRGAFDLIVENLVSNALRYGAGPVEVHLSSRDDCAEVRVHDHGAGIASEDCTGVFDRFGHASTEPSSGCGVALWTCQRLAHAMSGSLVVERDGAFGCTFLLSLPLGSDLRP